MAKSEKISSKVTATKKVMPMSKIPNSPKQHKAVRMSKAQRKAIADVFSAYGSMLELVLDVKMSPSTRSQKSAIRAKRRATTGWGCRGLSGGGWACYDNDAGVCYLSSKLGPYRG